MNFACLYNEINGQFIQFTKKTVSSSNFHEFFSINFRDYISRPAEKKKFIKKLAQFFIYSCISDWAVVVSSMYWSPSKRLNYTVPVW